jgi:AraC-like DNA-binding protein
MKTTSFPPVDPSRYAPTRDRPLRAKVRHMAAHTRIEPHSHPWAQVAFSAVGVIRMNAGAATFIVPPSRMVWIPPGVEHVVTVVEDAEIRTLYLHQAAGHAGPADPLSAPVDGDCNSDHAIASVWRSCRVLEVSALLRELVLHLPAEPGPAPATPREVHLTALVRDELLRARALPIGIDLPRDKRLRSLCEAVLDDPARWTSLEDWARDAGASPRTAARLFRAELGTTFVQWRQQVLLARALTLAAGRMPMTQIAAELGYASPSAFSAMVRRSVGESPSRFFGQQSSRIAA